MKSLIGIEKEWYEDDFCQLYEYGHTILDYNQLPNSNCPFDTLLIQQHQELDPGLNREEVANMYDESSHMTEIVQNLNDYHKASILANMTEEDWLVYKTTGVINGQLQIPEDLIDEREAVSFGVREELANCQTVEDMAKVLSITPGYEVPASGGSSGGGGVSGWFWGPRGEVMISVGGTVMEIPAYPESVKDTIGVSWSQEMTTVNHYEPVQTFKNSGPRTVSCTFKLHQAMWTGGDDSATCDALVALMESACYPDYSTQASEPPMVTLVIGASIQINGVMTAFDKTYQGPISEVGKYDEVIISVTITEISKNVLDTNAVKGGLSGVR